MTFRRTQRILDLGPEGVPEASAAVNPSGEGKINAPPGDTDADVIMTAALLGFSAGRFS